MKVKVPKGLPKSMLFFRHGYIIETLETVTDNILQKVHTIQLSQYFLV